MDLVLDPKPPAAEPQLTLSKGFGIKYGSTDDWTDRFRGYGKLYVEALELTKQKLELDQERQGKSRKQKTWRELDAMPAPERAKHREQYRKVDDAFDKRHSAIQSKCDALETKLLDEKIAEAKAERLGKSCAKDDGKPGESLGETSTEELQATLADLAHRLKAKPGDKAIQARQKAISSELKGRGTKKSLGLTLDLQKAKYTKRTGTPGNYRYEYAGSNGGKPEPKGKGTLPDRIENWVKENFNPNQVAAITDTLIDVATGTIEGNKFEREAAGKALGHPLPSKGSSGEGGAKAGGATPAQPKSSSKEDIAKRLQEFEKAPKGTKVKGSAAHGSYITFEKQGPGEWTQTAGPTRFPSRFTDEQVEKKTREIGGPEMSEAEKAGSTAYAAVIEKEGYTPRGRAMAGRARDKASRASAKKGKAGTAKPGGPTVTVTGGTQAAEKTVGRIGPNSGPQEVRSAMISITAAAREKPESKAKWREVVAGMAKKVKDPKAKKILAQAAKLLSKSLGPATKGEDMQKAKYVKRTGTPGNYKYEYTTTGGKRGTTSSRGAVPKESKPKRDLPRPMEANLRDMKPGESVLADAEKVGKFHGTTAAATQATWDKLESEGIVEKKNVDGKAHYVRVGAKPGGAKGSGGNSKLAKVPTSTLKDMEAGHAKQLAAHEAEHAKGGTVSQGRYVSSPGQRQKAIAGVKGDLAEVRKELSVRGESAKPEATKKSFRQPRASTHGLSPSNIRETTAHADAVFRSKALRGPADVVIGGGRASVLAKSRDGSLVTTEVADVLLQPTPLAFQRVLCKSVFPDGCDEQFSKALSACPGCGAGTVESRGMPSFSEIGVEVTSDVQGFCRPRVPADIVIKD